MAAARPQRRLPRGLVVAAALALGARFVAPSTRDRVAWVRLDEAVRIASETGKPILYDFTAEWCAPCRLLEREAFADLRRAASINKEFVPVKVVDREKEDGQNPPEVEALQKRYDVTVFPTLVVAWADGSVLEAHEGFTGQHKDFNDFMNTVYYKVRAKQSPRTR